MDWRANQIRHLSCARSPARPAGGLCRPARAGWPSGSAGAGAAEARRPMANMTAHTSSSSGAPAPAAAKSAHLSLDPRTHARTEANRRRRAIGTEAAARGGGRGAEISRGPLGARVGLPTIDCSTCIMRAGRGRKEGYNSFMSGSSGPQSRSSNDRPTKSAAPAPPLPPRPRPARLARPGLAR